MSGKWQMVKVPWIIFIRYGSLSFVGPCPWLLLASIMFPIVMFTEGAASTPPPLFSVQCTHSLDLKVASGWCRSFKNLVPEYPYSILHTGHSYIYTEDYKLNWLTPLTGHWLLFLLFVSLTKMWCFWSQRVDAMHIIIPLPAAVQTARCIFQTEKRYKLARSIFKAVCLIQYAG